MMQRQIDLQDLLISVHATLRHLDVQLGGKLHLIVAICIFTIGVPALGRVLGHGAVAIVGVMVLMFGKGLLSGSAK